MASTTTVSLEEYLHSVYEPEDRISLRITEIFAELDEDIASSSGAAETDAPNFEEGRLPFRLGFSVLTASQVLPFR
ncbi:MAG: hypothetical protein ACREHV_14590 [Rhizomicrobium sp.]